MHPRQFVVAAALALGLAATVLAGPSTALAAKKPQGGEIPTSPGIDPPRPQILAKVDLTPSIMFFDLSVEPGEELQYGLFVRNLGNADASNVQVDAIAGLPFQNIQVTDAAGFACSVTTSTEGVVPGHWLACTGGQVPAGGHVLIKLKANAPTAPGFYKMVTSADPHNTIFELNGENNNHDEMTFHVS